MPLETGTFIDDLNAANPVGATDPKSQGDDHLRLIKSTIKATFPNIAGEMSLTHTQLNAAVIKNEANELTAAASSADYPVKLKSTTPLLALEETDGAANGKVWDFGAAGGVLLGRSRSDLYGAGSTWLTVARAAAVITTVTLDASAGVALNYSGAKRFDTGSSGVASVFSDGSTDGESRRLDLKHADGTIRGVVGYTAASSLQVNNRVHGALVQLTAEDTGGVGRTVISGDPDGATDLYYAGTRRLRMSSVGTILLQRDDNSDTTSCNMQFQHQNSTLRGFVGYNGSSLLEFQNRVHGGDIALAAEDAGGVLRTVLFGDPDGSANLYYQGALRLAVDSLGLVCKRSTSDDVTDSRLRYQHANGTDRALVGFLGSGDFTIRGQVHGASILLQQEDAAGATVTVLEGDPDGATSLYHDGNIEAQTQDSDAIGNTSGMQTKSHGGTMRDIGFNVLPLFNDDLSDTLEASHCGVMNVLDDAVDRTLTLEASSSTDFPVGGVTHVANLSAANSYNVTEGTGVTLYYLEPGTGQVDTTGGAVVGPGGVASVYRRSAAVYWIWGSEISYTP